MPLRFESCLLLVNPTRHPRSVKRLLRKLEGARGIEIVITRSKEHFTTCAGEFFAGPYRNLLVWGGDGTAHDAINAIYPFDDTTHRDKAIGFLRGGTGNGIQDSYEVPYRLGAQLSSYARSMRNGYTIAVDLLKVLDGDRVRYGQLVGVGFDAEVLQRRERRTKRNAEGTVISRSGVTKYLSAGFARFFAEDLRSERSTWNVVLNDGKYAFRGPRVNAEFPFRRLQMRRAPLMIEIGTRPYYGKLFKVCPDVVCNDGNMDVYLYDFNKRFEVVRNALYLWTGRHSMINRTLSRARKPVIERYEVTRTTLEQPQRFDYHIDGELHHASARRNGKVFGIDIEILPRALTFLVPAQFYHIFHPFSENPDVPDVHLKEGGAAKRA